MVVMKANEYKCSSCHNVYEKGWTDEEAKKETEELHGRPASDPDMVVVCDDCFNGMRGQGLF